MNSTNDSPSRWGDALLQLVRAQKQGTAAGIYSVCSAHPAVIAACARQAARDGSPLLIESTSNQVNQYGGYTGMTPAEFAGFVRRITARAGLPAEQVITGGDHLGPHPWQGEPAEQAMQKAAVLVSGCVQAGFRKIHLDASMKLGGDDPDAPLPVETAAERAAQLCAAAEESTDGRRLPVYVIGTEVPIPGGVFAGEEDLAVTRVDDARKTIEVTRAAFFRLGLEEAWNRVIAVVVQPGVEYGDATIHEYNPAAAAELSGFIEGFPTLVYEAHSTDYQTPEALRALVRDHFAVLKVGPGLTYAYREAVFALAMMEEEWLSWQPGVELSRLREKLEQAMLSDSGHWDRYYAGSPAERAFARRYSFSDRSRYYWPAPEVQAAVERLVANFEQHPAPLSLLSQFMPAQYRRVRAGSLENRPQALIEDRIMDVAADYSYACGYRSAPAEYN
ncbi:MAG TPA: class II D-tagatose-bisphosphate aldolase, non-catalytic subunit [Anaerolineaceae bacterium]|nr:class II D-tagatose-bisphosphate aldolase, non-catalytic subunit [Anaerolineaceae bacterium]